MSEKKPLRVLFCMGINQNFFDAAREEQLEVWAAFSAMWTVSYTHLTLPTILLV